MSETSASVILFIGALAQILLSFYGLLRSHFYFRFFRFRVSPITWPVITARQRELTVLFKSNKAIIKFQ